MQLQLCRIRSLQKWNAVNRWHRLLIRPSDSRFSILTSIHDANEPKSAARFSPLPIQTSYLPPLDQCNKVGAFSCHAVEPFKPECLIGNTGTWPVVNPIYHSLLSPWDDKVIPALDNDCCISIYPIGCGLISVSHQRWGDAKLDFSCKAA